MMRSRISARVGAALLLVEVAAMAGCRAADKPSSPPPPPSAAAAAQPAAPASVAPLAGTSWRLVEFQSMDDAIGTVKPADPSLYTLALNADGTVAMRLNCNRATGSWSAQPETDRSRGSFTFGPLAGTRALCPPPSLDEKILAHAPYVRGYVLKDGKLALTLMADGGIYLWEPVPGGGAGG